jgi:hypothetical protein
MHEIANSFNCIRLHSSKVTSSSSTTIPERNFTRRVIKTLSLSQLTSLIYKSRNENFFIPV